MNKLWYLRGFAMTKTQELLQSQNAHLSSLCQGESGGTGGMGPPGGSFRF